jgi:hypothetical protein
MAPLVILKDGYKSKYIHKGGKSPLNSVQKRSSSGFPNVKVYRSITT